MAREFPEVEPNRETVRKAIEKAFPFEVERVMEEMTWSGVTGCWMVRYCGMFVGIEKDGYVHS
jgi:nitrogen regulatory protein PII-like uncharacterized protein